MVHYRSRAKAISIARAILISVVSLVAGVILGAATEHYIIPLYFTPHSALRVMQGDLEITVDNINGQAPIDWVKITITATNGTFTHVKMTGTSPFDIGYHQFSTDQKAYFFIINHMSPDDWGDVTMQISGSQNFTLEVSSSSQYILGDVVSIGYMPKIGAWDHWVHSVIG